MNLLQGTVLITGAGKRVGATIARELHGAGMNVVIHYRGSRAEAEQLATELNRARVNSAHCLQADLTDVAALETLADQAHACWGRLDALVNNASTYYKTPVGEITEEAFDDLIGSNLKAPLFLIQACLRHLREGVIVNMVDINAHKPRKGYIAYCAAKAGLVSLTESLAKELAPRIRVNAVAPGYMLWSEHDGMNAVQREGEIKRVPLQRLGSPNDIARLVRFLVSPDSAYLNGAIIPVDGGLRLV